MINIYPKSINNSFNNYKRSKFSPKSQNFGGQLKADSFTSSAGHNVSFTSYHPTANNLDPIYKIVNWVKRSGRTALAAHRNTDMDAAASMAALGRIIEIATGQAPDIFVMNPLPRRFDFIDPEHKIKVISELIPGTHDSPVDGKRIAKEFGQYDLVIALDTCLRDLFDSEIFSGIVKRAKKVIKIDHHPVENVSLRQQHKYDYGSINLVDPTKDSASQLVMEFVEPFGLNPEQIEPCLSNKILAGMLSDTNNLKHVNPEGIAFTDIAELSKTSDYNSIREAVRKLPIEDMQKASQIVGSEVRFSHDRSIAYFVVDTAQKGINSDIIYTALEEISKFEGIKYYFTVVKNSKKPEEGIYASVRSQSKPIRKLIEKMGELGGGRDYACRVVSHEMTPNEMVSELIVKLNELENEQQIVQKLNKTPKGRIVHQPRRQYA